ncbi:MAG TPA: dienelactone hydrolase family protein [Albitalea sp.]|nr:dienelactone hydrolase family protein [Albitalea sp.]
MKGGLLSLMLLASVPPALAKLVDQQIDLPVEVKNAYGKEVAQTIKVTVFTDDTTATPRPILVINHGRAPDAADRAALGRARYTEVSRWFAAQGFLVAVPTRVGYGVSRGEDVEDSGDCSRKNYPPGYEAAAQQTLAVLAAMRARPDTVKDRSLVVGQSYGGTTSVTVAALNPPGVVATINFAGGGGGNPKTRPQEPCLPTLLERMFDGYGRSARIPTLWIYAENDMYMGPRYPRQWFEAFNQAGGGGEFVQFPPHGDDGHSLFTRFPATWQPVVSEFLRKQGYMLKDSP